MYKFKKILINILKLFITQEPDDEEDETDLFILETLVDLIPTTAKVFKIIIILYFYVFLNFQMVKDYFIEPFKMLYPEMKIYLSEERDINDNI